MKPTVGTTCCVPGTWWWLLGAFFVFRFFDILKPWPIGRVERSFAGGFGVMVDDVIAGLTSLVCLALINWGMAAL